MSLQGFRDGSIQCLVATNVAARGLDIPEVQGYLAHKKHNCTQMDCRIQGS